MTFNSIEFFIFLPLALFVFYSLNKDRRTQSAVLITVSYIFYGFWDWRFLFLILLSTVADFCFGLMIEKKTHYKKHFLLASLILNLGLLATFKYFNFFIDSFSQAFSFFGLNMGSSSLDLILPVGISFYTFQTLSYTIDVYKGKIKATSDFVSFAAFVSFFPQLVAGPIERASRFLPQFDTAKRIDSRKVSTGLKLMLWGFFLKIAVANRAAIYVDSVYDYIQQQSGLSALIGTFAFGLQIYGDFAGYSFIAIGTAKLFGFDLMHNFNIPYLATSFRDFWNRWHISLSTWFRDYVYIPLGGNRVSNPKTLLNLVITFGVSGLWHGANWTFVLWGLGHALLVISERLLDRFKVISYLKWLMTFISVNLLWVLFRSESIQQAKIVFGKMFTLNLQGFRTGDKSVFYFMVMAAVILVTSECLKRSKFNFSPLFAKSQFIRILSIVTLIIYIITLGVFDSSQFIYFQF